VPHIKISYGSFLKQSNWVAKIPNMNVFLNHD
jgi:hypothetical protein